jgi:hypothetical protein
VLSRVYPPLALAILGVGEAKATGNAFFKAPAYVGIWSQNKKAAKNSDFY